MAVANQTVSQTVESGAPVAAAAAAVSSADDAARFSSSSLYVGDLNPDATEQDLLEVFGAIGPISSIRLLRDAVTRRSLQYAYVNFQSAADADRALEALNFSELKGRPMRVMWLQRDPSMRRSGLGNIFVKNLAKDIDNKSLYDTFSPFGNILSCKVAMASDGKSKGYGYVHFETQEAADAAIATVNKMMLAGTRVEVMRFVPRRERSGSDGEPKFNNVYVKNFPETWTEDDLAKIFEPHGDILSVFVRRDEGTGSSKGFGFVTFGTPEAAKSAVDALNGAEIAPGKQVFVGRAQKKTERMSVLRRKFEQLKMERMTKYQGVNLYIKNLDDNATDDMLRKAFEEFGNITSAKVMYDERGISRGFGFVCFTTPEEATRAVTQMNGRMLGSKPLYVAIAQKREFRQAQLAAQYAQRNMMAASAAAAAAAAAAMQYGQMAPPPGAPGSQAPAPNGAPGGRGMPPPGMFFPPGVVPPQGQQFMYPPPGGMRRWNGPQNAQPAYDTLLYPDDTFHSLSDPSQSNSHPKHIAARHFSPLSLLLLFSFLLFFSFFPFLGLFESMNGFSNRLFFSLFSFLVDLQ
eukprot:ANDGO_06902.mRNA.1 Polyadenylate-binding protein